MANNFKNLLIPLRILIRLIRNKDEDDHHFNNPFVIF